MTVHGTMTFAQLTAAYLYSEVVFDSAKIICDQLASVLENLGTIDTVLQYASLLDHALSTTHTYMFWPMNECASDQMFWGACLCIC